MTYIEAQYLTHLIIKNLYRTISLFETHKPSFQLPVQAENFQQRPLGHKKGPSVAQNLFCDIILF